MSRIITFPNTGDRTKARILVYLHYDQMSWTWMKGILESSAWVQYIPLKTRVSPNRQRQVDALMRTARSYARDHSRGIDVPEVWKTILELK